MKVLQSLTAIILSTAIYGLQSSCSSNAPAGKQKVSGIKNKTIETPAATYTEQESTAKEAHEKKDVMERLKTNNVTINGIALNAKQVQELKHTYGIEPKDGSYWYDSKSGLYGAEGYQAFGFMRAGHHFGKLKSNASAGNSGVIVNGRNLPLSEWYIWSALLGAAINPGSYWLDERGNAGDEGNPYPTVNLYEAAQRNAYRGNSGGDNFWTSRFSAGNSNADNSQGYVSVPGYGPIGYGF